MGLHHNSRSLNRYRWHGRDDSVVFMRMGASSARGASWASALPHPYSQIRRRFGDNKLSKSPDILFWISTIFLHNMRQMRK